MRLAATFGGASARFILHYDKAYGLLPRQNHKFDSSSCKLMIETLQADDCIVLRVFFLFHYQELQP